MKSKVITSRKWHNPSIKAFISHDEVGAVISMDDFLTALVEEIGNPTTMLTKAQLKAKLELASIAILGEMRSTTAYVL